MRTFVFIIFVATWTLLTGCGDSQPAAADYDGPPKRGGELIVATQADGRSLDPHKVTDAASMRLIENMYSTLMRYSGEYGEVEMDLVSTMNVSDDGLTYTFTLRPDARFHSGRAVEAQDVKYSIERIIDQKVRADQFADIQRIAVIDPLTFKLMLSRPSAALPTFLAYPMNAIVDQQVVDQHGGSLDAADGGSGPFKLIEWRKDRYLKLARHDQYHVDGRPYLDAITFRPISDETARTTALRTREVDLILDLPLKDVPTIQRAGGIVVQSVPGTFWEYIGMNTKARPFDDVRVRQAVAMAIDRTVLNKIIKFGAATVLDGGHIPPNHWAYAAELHPYAQRDVQGAKKLLAEAGFGDGFQTVMKVGSAFAYQVDAAQMVKQQLSDIGIDVELRPLESGLFFDALGKSDFEMTLVGWVGFVDPDEWMFNLFHSSGRFNQQHFSDAALDDLLEQGRITRDRAERLRIYTQAQRIIALKAPVASLYINPQTTAMLSDVRGYQTHPTATTLSLRNTWLAR